MGDEEQGFLRSSHGFAQFFTADNQRDLGSSVFKASLANKDLSGFAEYISKDVLIIQGIAKAAVIAHNFLHLYFYK